jgi:Ankyrin repeats (3 copies)
MNSSNNKSIHGTGMRVPKTIQSLFLRSKAEQCSQLPTGSRSKTGTVQTMLESNITARGYDVRSFETLKSGYYNKATELQKASYGKYVIDVVKEGDLDTLEDLLDAGLSSNPSNRHGESLVHMVCRLGHYQMLQAMLDRGARVQISNDNGRTPLHEICASSNPSFDAVAMLLEVDQNMFFMADRQGYLPLSYVPKSVGEKWIKFLERNMEEYWPKRSSLTPSLPSVPSIVKKSPNSKPLKNPKHAMTSELASLVATGKIAMEEAASRRSMESALYKSNSSFSDDVSTVCESDCESEM